MHGFFNNGLDILGLPNLIAIFVKKKKKIVVAENGTLVCHSFFSNSSW
jgi:hypothetical protein